MQWWWANISIFIQYCIIKNHKNSRNNILSQIAYSFYNTISWKLVALSSNCWVELLWIERYANHQKSFQKGGKIKSVHQFTHARLVSIAALQTIFLFFLHKMLCAASSFSSDCWSCFVVNAAKSIIFFLKIISIRCKLFEI